MSRHGRKFTLLGGPTRSDVLATSDSPRDTVTVGSAGEVIVIRSSGVRETFSPAVWARLVEADEAD